jgi:peptide-methionine (R)-S-oxide reductase
MIKLSKSFLILLMCAELAACSQTASHSSTSSEQTKPMSNPYYSRIDTTHLEVSNEEWKQILPRELYLVSREAHTERAFTGKYYEYEVIGTYYCAVCGNPLFRSDSKFHSGCGWPSFYAPTADDAVTLIEDRSLAPRIRTEVRCAACDSHLGHVFKGEGYDVPTDERWCINSVAMYLEEKK